MAIQLIVHTTFHVKACMFYVLQHRVHLCMNSAHWGNSRKSHFDDIHLYHCMLHLPPYCCYRYLGFPSAHLIAPSHNCTTCDADTDFATPLTNSFFFFVASWADDGVHTFIYSQVTCIGTKCAFGAWVTGFWPLVGSKKYVKLLSMHFVHTFFIICEAFPLITVFFFNV